MILGLLLSAAHHCLDHSGIFEFDIFFPIFVKTALKILKRILLHVKIAFTNKLVMVLIL